MTLVKALPTVLVIATLCYFVLVYRVTTKWYDERLSEQARELAILGMAFRHYEKKAATA